MMLNSQSKLGIYAVLTMLLCSAACFPLLSLIVKGWVSGTLFFATLIAVVLLLLPFFKDSPEGLRTQIYYFYRRSHRATQHYFYNYICATNNLRWFGPDVTRKLEFGTL